MKTVNIGIIGIGFMGYTHFEGARQLNGGRIAAIATRNERRLSGDWNGIQGNFGPPAGDVDLEGIKTFKDYHDLLNDPEIDLIDICLPTDLHKQVTLEALAAGKDVLVEKPIAIDPADAAEMVTTAENAGQLLMVGHVLPFFPEFRFAAETVKSGKYGKLLAAHFRRVMTPPEWSNNIADFRKLGGWGIDLHIHDNHFIRYLCGQPQSVFSRGILQDGFVNHVHTQYVYDQDAELAVSAVSGGIAAKGLDFAHGFELFLENATITYEAGTYGGEWLVNRPLALLDQEGNVTSPELPGGDEWCSAFTGELQVAVDAVISKQEPEILSGKLAKEALDICIAEAKSIAAGECVAP